MSGVHAPGEQQAVFQASFLDILTPGAEGSAVAQPDELDGGVLPAHLDGGFDRSPWSECWKMLSHARNQTPQIESGLQ
jgi:hypothetical protein